jgi:hypothetical protein
MCQIFGAPAEAPPPGRSRETAFLESLRLWLMIQTSSLVPLIFLSILLTPNPVGGASPLAETGFWGYAVDAARENRRFVAYQSMDINSGRLTATLMISFETYLKCQPSIGLSLRKGLDRGELKNSGFSSSPMTIQVDGMPPVEDKPGIAIYSTGIDFFFPPNERLFEQMMSGAKLHLHPEPSTPTYTFELAGLSGAIVQPRMDCDNAVKRR